MEPIAIIGIGCRLPGANNPEDFWSLLRDGVDAVTEVPAERWDVDAFYDPDSQVPGKMNTRWGGFIEQGAAQFDAQFFGIPPREAERMDPQHRLVLEVAWESLEDAAIAPQSLSGTPTGVFLGISHSDYDRLIYRGYTRLSAFHGTGTYHCIAANRISFLLNLTGPSVAIDTACSSSLVAIHLACQSLRLGESTVALAGGVNMNLFPEETIALSKARALAADGRCKVFDARADGYVRSEGCGILILKRLSDALRDGNSIRALIRGSAVNQDGLSNGLTSPNGIAQQALIRQALVNADLDSWQISYTEVHGSATLLGDAIEVKALKAVLLENRRADNTCWIGSGKTNIGHLEAAAGIAGVIKVTLSLQHGEIPPLLHLQQVSSYISLNHSPMSIATELQPWVAQEMPRIAGVSGFGFGGTNCHVVLEEAPPVVAVRSEPDRPLHLLALGAKNESALVQMAQRFEAYLAAHSEVNFADMCFTANTGRSHGDYRLAVIAANEKQARVALQSFLAHREDNNVVHGKAQPWSTRRDLDGEAAALMSSVPRDSGWPSRLKNLAQLYVAGAQVDWQRFDRKFRRYPLVLPTYPFQRQRYWID